MSASASANAIRIAVEIPRLRLGVALGEIRRAGTVGRSLRDDVDCRGIDHVAGVGNTDGGLGAQIIFDMLEIERVLREPRVGWHYGAGHDRLRFAQMIAMPIVGIFSADAGEVRPVRFEPHWKGWSYMLSAASE